MYTIKEGKGGSLRKQGNNRCAFATLCKFKELGLDERSSHKGIEGRSMQKNKMNQSHSQNADMETDCFLLIMPLTMAVGSHLQNTIHNRSTISRDAM